MAEESLLPEHMGRTSHLCDLPRCLRQRRDTSRSPGIFTASRRATRMPFMQQSPQSERSTKGISCVRELRFASPWPCIVGVNFFVVQRKLERTNGGEGARTWRNKFDGEHGRGSSYHLAQTVQIIAGGDDIPSSCQYLRSLSRAPDYTMLRLRPDGGVAILCASCCINLPLACYVVRGQTPLTVTSPMAANFRTLRPPIFFSPPPNWSSYTSWSWEC